MQKRLLRWLEVAEHKANMGAEVGSKEFVGKCLVWDLTEDFHPNETAESQILEEPWFPTLLWMEVVFDCLS